MASYETERLRNCRSQSSTGNRGQARGPARTRMIPDIVISYANDPFSKNAHNRAGYPLHSGEMAEEFNARFPFGGDGQY